MRSKCFTPVRGRVMRVTRTDGCGRPLYGPDSVGVSKGFVSIAATGNSEEGEAISVTNANGDICVSEPAKAQFQNFTLEITFCNVDPALFSLMTGQEVLTDPDTGEAIGFTVNSDVDTSASGFALEAWTGVPGVQCSDDPNAQGTFGYLLWPFVTGGVFGDFTLENGAVTFVVSGATTKTGSSWGAGPYDVQMVGGVPSPLSTPVQSGEHFRLQVVEVAPPPEFCGLQPAIDPNEGDALVSIAATDDGLEVTITPTPSDTTPWAVWLGDGMWDYVEGGGAYVYVYDEPGTYTITAQRGGATVTETVTVTN